MKVALVTGDRADWSALGMLEGALLQAGERFEVTWIRLSGTTVHAAAGDMLGWLAYHSPDLIVLHGDRFETLGAAVTANVTSYPIAHLSGGDITEGSQDDCYRHAITKLSHLHFPSNAESARRIAQMGEQPDRIHTVGCPSIDRIARTEHLSRIDTLGSIGLEACERCVLVALHPDTLGDTGELAEAVYGALSSVPRHVGIVFTAPNADQGSRVILKHWWTMVAHRPNTVYREDYDNRFWLSLMAHCDLLIGNSSCAFYEAPSLALPCINVGDRQKGRIRTKLVYDVPVSALEIDVAIVAILSGTWRPRPPAVNPYGDGHACERIVEVLASIRDPKSLLRKVFYDGGHDEAEAYVGGGAPAPALGYVPGSRDGAVRAAEVEAGGAGS